MIRKLSKISEKLIGQPMFKLLSEAKKMEAKGRKIYHFEIGDSISESPIVAVEAAQKALDNGKTHYTDSMGMIELRQSISEYTKKHWGFKPKINQILVCPANAAIDFIIRCVADLGDEIIYPDPGFPTYYSAINYNGMNPVNVELKKENQFRLNPDDVGRKITKKTKLIIMNSPSNPTGAVMKEEEVKGIAELAKKNNVYLLSDEVYSRILYSGKHYSPCIYDQCKEHTLLLNSFSKSHSMAGWRLGYIIGPEELISKLNLLLQTILSCVSPFIQLGGKAVLDKRNYSNTVLELLDKKRRLLCDGLNNLNGIMCKYPNGAFYAFPDITKTGMTGIEYADKLLKSKGVCVLPGEHFGEYGKGYLRMCFASADVHNIEVALNMMYQFHESVIE